MTDPVSPQGTPETCGDSTFDRSLCMCVEGGVMHTYVCEKPVGHRDAHEGEDPDAPCGVCTWTDGGHF